jgi:hypothetical protein
MQMGPEEGTQVTATALLPLAEWMTSVFEDPDDDTLRLDFEDLTKSSARFDSGVQRFLGCTSILCSLCVFPREGVSCN